MRFPPHMRFESFQSFEVMPEFLPPSPSLSGASKGRKPAIRWQDRQCFASPAVAPSAVLGARSRAGAWQLPVTGWVGSPQASALSIRAPAGGATSSPSGQAAHRTGKEGTDYPSLTGKAGEEVFQGLMTCPNALRPRFFSVKPFSLPVSHQSLLSKREDLTGCFTPTC